MGPEKFASDASEGAVLTCINKRIRNLRKKLRRIEALEDSIAQGKSIVKNMEQEELLRSKTSILAVVHELENFRQPLSVAVDEEITRALQRRHVTASEDSDRDEDCKKTQTLDEEKGETKPSPVDVKDLLSLIYFGSMFDVKPLDPSLSWDERSWCLLYDSFREDPFMLRMEDLDTISMLSSLVISRPEDCSLVSHKDALQRCIEHANRWICKSEKRIDPNSDVTYAGVREMLAQIMRLGYFERPPAPGSRKYDVVGEYRGSKQPSEDEEGEELMEDRSSQNTDFDSKGQPRWDPYCDFEGYLDSD